MGPRCSDDEVELCSLCHSQLCDGCDACTNPDCEDSGCVCKNVADVNDVETCELCGGPACAGCDGCLDPACAEHNGCSQRACKLHQ